MKFAAVGGWFERDPSFLAFQITKDVDQGLRKGLWTYRVCRSRPEKVLLIYDEVLNLPPLASSPLKARTSSCPPIHRECFVVISRPHQSGDCLTDGEIAELRDNQNDRCTFVEDVFSRLQNVEPLIAHRLSTRTSRYLDGGAWFIRPRFAIDCLGKRLRRPGHHPILAGVSLRQLGRLFRSYLRNGTIEIRSRAAAANVRQRVGACIIRSFYPYARQPVTAKVSWPDGSRLEAEVENRRVVQEIGHLQVPALTAMDFTDRYPFLLEEMVTGRLAFRRNDQALLHQLVFPNLQRHYAGFGISGKPIVEYFGDDIVAKVEQAAEQVTWDRQWQDRQQFMRVVGQLAASGKSLCLSFCHGDLTAAHVVVAHDGRVLLLDWESAGVQPIAFDLATILRTFRRINHARLYEACERLLSELSRTGKTGDFLLPSEQIFWASLHKIFSWNQFQDYFKIHGKDPAAELKLVFGRANALLKHTPLR